MFKSSNSFLNYLKKHLRKIILIISSFVLGAILFAAVFLYIDYEEMVHTIFSFSWQKFVIFLAAASLPLIITTYRWSLVLKAHGFRVKFKNLFKYRLVGFGFSYLTPIAELGGAPFRAYLLQKEGIPFKKGLLTVIIDNFIEVLSMMGVAAFSVMIFISRIGISQKMEWVIGITSFFFVFLVVWLFVRLRRGKFIITAALKNLHFKKIQKRVARVEKPFIDFFQHNKKTFYKTMALSLLVFGIIIFNLGLLLFLLGHYIGFFNTFLAKIISDVSNFFPLPAALGVAEWGLSSFFSSIAKGKSVGFVFSILFKAKNLFYSFIGIAFFLGWWHKKNRWDRLIFKYFKQKLNV
jgi:uncharacterized protein (TIRG00374 family)